MRNRWNSFRALLTGATCLIAAGCAQQTIPAVVDAPVPPFGRDDPVAQIAEQDDPANSPITGASILAGTVGGERPPSLEALMATRPGINPESKLPTDRAEELRTAALGYGAAGGLAAEGFAIDEKLRRHEAQLDRAFDFSPLMVHIGGQTLMRPPTISEAQQAFALGAGGQTARETSRIYRITRQGELASRPPNWRGYLVQAWPDPLPPADELRPRTKQEVEYWNKWVAEGWSKGQAQGADIFLSQLGKLKADLIGMARYDVLLRAGLVEKPRVAILKRAVEGGHDSMRIGDTSIKITGQPGLNGNRGRWHQQGLPEGPIGEIPAR